MHWRVRTTETTSALMNCTQEAVFEAGIVLVTFRDEQASVKKTLILRHPNEAQRPTHSIPFS